MREATTLFASPTEVTNRLTLGLDLGDRTTHYALFDGGAVTERGSMPTTRGGLTERFATLPPSLVALEVSTHSPWVSALFERWGHTVIVANAREVQYISRSTRKSDRVDAEALARLARVDPELLHPVRHRGEEVQQDRAVLRARDALVRARTLLINNARGLAKTAGARLPQCSADSFHRRVPEAVPPELRPALTPLVEAVGALTEHIRDYDRQVQAMLSRYEETRLLQQPRGVGPLTALTYVLTIEDPGRFSRSRMVGAYVGLVPSRRQSGDRDPQLHISRAGDRMLRRLLVECAQYMLGAFGEDSDLRRWGLRLAGEGSRARKRRAVIAVARKLAALLHYLWVNGAIYEPLHQAA